MTIIGSYHLSEFTMTTASFNQAAARRCGYQKNFVFWHRGGCAPLWNGRSLASTGRPSRACWRQRWKPLTPLSFWNVSSPRPRYGPRSHHDPARHQHLHLHHQHRPPEVLARFRGYRLGSRYQQRGRSRVGLWRSQKPVGTQPLRARDVSRPAGGTAFDSLAVWAYGDLRAALERQGGLLAPWTP